jgi:beta-lactamase regulating signal transducer with metallopeptidase domain
MSSLPSVAAWLATYAVHSTILLLFALVSTRFIASHAAKETIWKATIIAGLFTASFQTFTRRDPIAGRFDVTPSPITAEMKAQMRDIPLGVASVPDIQGVEIPKEPRKTPIWTSWTEPRFLMKAGLVLWVLVSLALMARLIVRHRRLLRALNDRRGVADGSLPGMLAELRRRAAVWTPVRLTSSSACPTPIAIGKAEICIPNRFETDLDTDQQRSALAHELAHLKRRDPFWQLSAGIIESIFFFQPLNYIARKRMRDAAEYLCDDWAVEQTSSPMALARCLTQISSWVGSAPIHDGMLAMAEGGSPLVQRIQRLAEWNASGSRSAHAAFITAAVLVAVVATSAPAFSARMRFPFDAGESHTQTQVRREFQSAAPSSVTLYNGPTAALDQRWQWAQRNAPAGLHWVGWEIDGVDSHGVAITSSTKNVPQPGASAPTLSRLVPLANADREPVAILIELNGDAITATRFQHGRDHIYLGARRLMWLGHANTRESLSRLDVLMNGARLDVMKELAAAHAIHTDRDLVIPAMRSIITSAADPEVRTEAVQWLARLHSDDSRVVDLLTETTLANPDAKVRLEAVDGLRTALRTGNPKARESLTRIAGSDTDMRVRSEAMQALTQQR